MGWFRWWHGTLTDAKFQWVARKSGQSFPTVIAMWVALLERASSAGEGETRGATECNGDATDATDATRCNVAATRGNIEGFDCDVHDVLFGVDDGSCARILAALTEKGLVCNGRIGNWEKRQTKRNDSGNPATGVLSSTERSRLKRERDKLAEQGCNADATQCNAAQRDATTDTDTDIDKPKPPIPPEGGVPIVSKKRTAVSFATFVTDCRSKGEDLIPEDDPVFRYAEDAGINREWLRLQWSEFKDRHRDPDAKRYKDWRAVYRKSVRGNWFKLWFIRDDGACGLTTQGQQAKQIFDTKAARS